MDSQQGEAVLNGQIANAGKSKLRTRSPEKFREAVEAQVEGSKSETTFIDLDGLNEALEQSGIPLDQATEALGISPEQYFEALATEGQVEVKTADLLSNEFFHDNLEAIKPHTKRDAEDMTPHQLAPLREAAEQEIEDAKSLIAERIEGDLTLAEQVADVEQRVFERIEGAGIYTGKALQVQADVHAALINALALRTGENPVEFFEREAPRIFGSVGGEVMSEGALLQVGDQKLLVLNNPVIPPDEEGFTTTAERAINNPPPRFRDARALRPEQWRKYFKDAGATGEAFEFQIERALGELEPDAEGKITKAAMARALREARPDVETKVPLDTSTATRQDRKSIIEADYSDYVAPGSSKNYKQELIIIPNEAEGYQSHNWKHDGVVGHIRTSDRTTVNGEEVRFVEELQSDLHQEAVKYGYQTSRSRLDVENILEKDFQEKLSRYNQWRVENNGPRFDTIEAEQEVESPEGLELFREARAAQRRVFDGQDLPLPPRAPLQNWEKPFIRRTLQQALADGKEVVAFRSMQVLNVALQNEGTRKFYNDRLPAHLKKVAKEIGGEFTQVEIKFGKEDARVPAIRLTA